MMRRKPSDTFVLQSTYSSPSRLLISNDWNSQLRALPPSPEGEGFASVLSTKVDKTRRSQEERRLSGHLKRTEDRKPLPRRQRASGPLGLLKASPEGEGFDPPRGWTVSSARDPRWWRRGSARPPEFERTAVSPAANRAVSRPGRRASSSSSACGGARPRDRRHARGRHLLPRGLL